MISERMALTTGNTMHLMLYEKIDERHKVAEKRPGKIFSILNGACIWGAKINATDSPW